MRRRTKLVCTIGPASADMVEALAVAGMDVARINLSHGTPRSHAAVATSIRRAAGSTGRPLGLLVDLAGPKIRLGDLAGGTVTLESGQPFVLRVSGPRSSGDPAGASVSYALLAADVEVGDPVLLADGAVELRVTGTTEDAVRTEVVRGGSIRSRAGVAIPAVRLSTAALTDRDRSDVRRARELGASHVGQSFVRSPRDVVELRQLLGVDGPPIVAKIETRPAVDAFDDILDVVDGVMIARGDLGVELPYEEVPLIQKQLLRRALDRGVPSIVATQMLESMTAAPRPTRAEASDVANAVFDGTDAIMLSAETAIGEYPILAAEAATRIAALCETHGAHHLPRGMSRPPTTDADALDHAAVALASAHADIGAIACYTRTGRTARVLSSLRPRVPVIAFSPDPEVVDRLTLVRGVVPRCTASLGTADPIAPLGHALDESGLVADGVTVVLVGAVATAASAPDVLAVHHVGGG
jgi:pyruvate kinase